MPNRDIRIKADLFNDTVLKVDLEQDFDNIEILSLKIDKNIVSTYKKHKSDYGCIVGRVTGNGNFGISNVKVSIFLKKEGDYDDTSIVAQLYPYTSISTLDKNNKRYNLLPKEGGDDCYQPVGSFEHKRMILDDKNVLEIYDTYYKYTTVTNDAGDFMLFGVPTGEQILHYDLDISDCGLLSQSPRDLIYQGYNANSFASPSMFNKSDNLDSLPQIYTDNQSINVYSFWGDDADGEVAITRKDFKVNYDFKPTCVFMGSIVTDTKDNGFNTSCTPTEYMGTMSNLKTGMGTIEMIRKTPDGGVEEYQVSGTQLIDENGVWCYQIPMNLDYVTMDEYGNIIPTDDSTNGIPTRARVRFRISFTENGGDEGENHLVKMLVPNNPETEADLDYVFGTNTLDDEFGTKSFRDLFWNKVYTVKGYIPRIQEGNGTQDKRFSGIKSINHSEGVNKFPYNNMRTFVGGSWVTHFQCNYMKHLIRWCGFINRVFRTSTTIGDGMCKNLEGWYFCPSCKNLDAARKEIINSRKEDVDKESVSYENNLEDENICVTNNLDYFISCMEEQLAMSDETIHFDFYNDWINGVLYIPRWFAKQTSKRRYRIGKTYTEVKLNACLENTFSGTYRRYTQQCALKYSNDFEKGYTNVISPNGCARRRQNCDTNEGRLYYRIFRKKGGVHEYKTYQEDSVYYFKPYEWETMMADQHVLADYRSNVIKKCPLFATDIVLLGSFNKCDKDGIVDVMKYLENSTYKMPPFSVETNMQSIGSMYQTAEGSVLCNGTDSGVKKMEDTFSNYEQWSNGMGIGDEEDPNMKEYAITLKSGVYWNQWGPNQNGRGYYDELFYPGGHFVGITCGYPEVNIKSCVNLSRICEIGVEPSSRKNIIIDKTLDDADIPEYGWAHIIPNGLISNDDIGKDAFRTAFATLNYNGLKTKKDENGRLKYDFIYINPRGFNGELRNRIGLKYNDENGQYDFGDDIAHAPEGDYEMAYFKTIEEFNKDYYYYRLGLKGNVNNSIIKSKYLFEGEGYVALPVYANSFYFYFGLKEGNTALDKFMKEYYSPCPNPNAYNSRYDIEETGEGIGYCDEYATSQITVTIYDMDGPYVIYLYKDEMSVKLSASGDTGTIFYVDEGEGSVYIKTNRRRFTIYGLSEGTYTTVIGGVNSSSIEQNITISKHVPAELENLEIIGEDYSKALVYDEIGHTQDFCSFNFVELVKPNNYWHYGEDEKCIKRWLSATEEGIFSYGRKDVGGNISLPQLSGMTNFKGYLLKTDNAYCCSINMAISGLTRYDYSNISEEGVCILAWEPNVNYYIYVLWNCGDEYAENIKQVYIGSVYISATPPTDLYYGTESVTWRRAYEQGIITNPSQSDNKWWEVEFSEEEENRKYLKGKTVWDFKKGIFYSGSLYDNNKKNTNFGYINRTEGLSVYGEYENLTFDESGNTNFKISPRDGLVDMDNITEYFPTHSYLVTCDNDLISGTTIEYVDKEEYPSEERKKMYEFDLWDLNAYAMSLYRPFYMRALIMEHDYLVIFPQFNSINIKVCAFNGVSNNGVMGDLKYRINIVNENEGEIKESVITGLTKTAPIPSGSTMDMDYLCEIIPELEEGEGENKKYIKTNKWHYSGHTETYPSMERLFGKIEAEIKDEKKEYVTSAANLNLSISINEWNYNKQSNGLKPSTITKNANVKFFTYDVKEKKGDVIEFYDTAFISTNGIHYFYIPLSFLQVTYSCNDTTYEGLYEKTVEYTMKKFSPFYEPEELTNEDWERIERLYHIWRKEGSGYDEDRELWEVEKIDGIKIKETVEGKKVEIDVVGILKSKGWCPFISKTETDAIYLLPIYWNGLSTYYYKNDKNGKKSFLKYIDLETITETQIKNLYENGNLFLGIYDKDFLTMGKETIKTFLSTSAEDRNIFKHLPKHRNELSVVKWYNSHKFKNILVDYINRKR